MGGLFDSSRMNEKGNYATRGPVRADELMELVKLCAETGVAGLGLVKD